MKKCVKGGPIVDTIKKKWNKWFRELDRKFGKLVKSEDIEEDGINGAYLEFKTVNGNTLQVKVFPSPRNEEEFLIQVAHDGGKDVYEPDKLFTEAGIDKALTRYCEDHNLGNYNDQKDSTEDDSEEVESTSKISVTLKKVAASDNTCDVHLCAINAGSNPIKAMHMLSDVLENDAFVDTITEEPVSFDIIEVKDAYDVNETQSVDTSNTFEDMLRACVECYHNLQAIHWGSKGEKFRDIHSIAESILYSVQYNMDSIAEWCVEYTKKVPNVLSYQYNALDTSCGFDFESGVKAVKQQIDNYIAVLECYYVNVEHDVQSVMDNWIRDLKMQSNYILDRTLLEDRCVEKGL